MPRFFVRQENISDKAISIYGEDAHHIARSLRMAVGDEITVCDMQGNEYLCSIEEFDEDREVRVKIVSVAYPENEPPCYIRLFQALPKGDKFDMIIQKAVECGASEIIPFVSERCVAKPKQETEARKTERRQKIALEAAKQCGRSMIPQVKESISYDAALKMCEGDELVLFCYEGDMTEPLGKILQGVATSLPKRISIFIGSEGGFSIKEASAAREKGFRMTGLGKRILRTETASGFVLACICCVTEL